MEILIPLPNSFSINTYSELKNYLQQLELSVHHAQKSVESAEKNGIEISQDCFVSFKHSRLENALNLEKSEELQNFTDNFYDELQEIELHINLQ